jgi:DNA-binding response OmpR family regulator
MRRARRPGRVGGLGSENCSSTWPPVTGACGTRLRLSRLEIQLLVRLAGDPARVFTKAELHREVWGFRAKGGTRTVDSHACRLRNKLALAGAPHHVVNVWGVGYRLLDPVTAPECNGAG